jgi:hypothetical protein
MNPLEQERKFFNDQQVEWSKLYPGKFVLVQGQELIGVFDTAENAVSEGLRRFGLNPFLVRNVLEKEEEVRIPALMFGLIHAIVPLPA